MWLTCQVYKADGGAYILCKWKLNMVLILILLLVMFIDVCLPEVSYVTRLKQDKPL